MADNPLDALKRANQKLEEAIENTILVWPHIPRCWIDMISEPTALLEKHKLKTGIVGQPIGKNQSSN